jgi:signal transduction histidine kinase
MRLLRDERFLRIVPVLAGAVVVLFTSFMLGLSNSAAQPVGERGIDADDFVWVAAAIVSAVTGALIVVRKRRNLVGWSLLGYGLVGSTGFAMFGLAILAMENRLETAAALLEGAGAGMISASFIMIPAALFLFPTGSLPSRRWRPLAWAMFAAAGIGFFVGFVNLGFGGDTSEALFASGPLEDSLGGIATALSGPYFLLVATSGIGAVISLVIRYGRSVGEERLQLKWVVAASLFFAMTLGVTFAVVGFGNVSGTGAAIVLALGLTAVPAAMGVAILKYRLYDIDVVISRSLTYGALAIFIGVVYVGIVVGIGELFDDGDGASVGLSIAATAMVAIAFQPVRTRVEHWANRLVYGERATPYEVLARFSQRAAEMSDENLVERIPRLIVDGTRSSGAALWVKSGTGFRTAASWPESDIIRTVDTEDTFTDPDANYSLPILHDGELLGGISLVNERGETITPAEEELLANLADGMGLALRNTQLTAELRRQVKDLKRSRDRVVSAADDARRSLEHDLDSGPQQQLVAVKVKLGPTRMLAERAGAAKTANVLADIEEQAGDAIRAIREFAAGIYPPLLGAEGLAVALGQQTQKAALPVSLIANEIGRFPRDVEAAVYFTVLEALQNTAKYAAASSVEVRLSEENGDLRFEVLDDGVGFDTSQVSKGAGLNGISDRMDIVGGSWEIESSSGSGTTLKGSVPVKDPVRV